MELNEIYSDHEQATVGTKVLLTIFAVVVVLALGYMVWNQNSSPDTNEDSGVMIKKTVVDKSTWKTLTNTALNLSIMYPNTWTLSAPAGTDPTKSTAPAWAAPCVYNDGVTCLQVMISQDVAVSTGTLANYVTNYLANNPTTTKPTQSATTLGGLPAIKVVFPKTTLGGVVGAESGAIADPLYKVDIFTLRNQKGFMLQATEQTKANAKTLPKSFINSAVFNAVAASLKFTN